MHLLFIALQSKLVYKKDMYHIDPYKNSLKRSKSISDTNYGTELTSDNHFKNILKMSLSVIQQNKIY